MNLTAEQWNERYPVGTPVLAYPGVRPEGKYAAWTHRRLDTVTRSVAWNLGGEPVVKVDGCAGGIALTHITVLHEPIDASRDTSWVLTPETIEEVDHVADCDDIYAKPYWDSVDGHQKVTGLRIGSTRRIVVKFGETVTRHAHGDWSVLHADGSRTIRPAGAER